MEKIRISAVKYANTYPFIYGFAESGFSSKAVIETDHPSECASKLISGKADIGLIPVGALPFLYESHIISSYCIGADGYVRTVELLSNTPFDDIKTIYLDYRSRTSVNLARVLAKNKWNRKFVWENTSTDFDFTNIRHGEATVLIGDQCFEYENSFSHKFDLAWEWKEFTGLPFVFACWTANRQLDDGFLADFNSALKLGIDNIDKVVENFGNAGVIRGADLKKYLTENIDYEFNDEKKKALNVFLELMSRL
ncbi:MAG TPA: menaquinone biosynthesis protein [Bacteroidales bacterium]|nr:menaquinone biosynthesis protein [Bacteroidales bacterium]